MVIVLNTVLARCLAQGPVCLHQVHFALLWLGLVCGRGGMTESKKAPQGTARWT